MKTYHAYIIHKVLAFFLFLVFFPLATVALILMVADVSPEYRGMLLFFLLWPVVTYLSYCLAIYLAAGMREITIHDGGLGIRELGKVFKGSYPVLQIAIRDIGDAQTVYGSVG
jgi:hypothetical protein